MNHLVYLAQSTLQMLFRDHVFSESKYLKTVQRTIARYCFLAHPENIMIAILNDKNEQVRYRGWKKLLEVRKSDEPNERVRIFNLPTSNFNANNYTEMIDWENITETILPILKKMDFGSNNAKFLAQKKLSDYELPFDLMKLPCHTQSVERCVKIVTEASLAVCGEERRNSLILNTLKSRQNTRIFRTKSDFNLNPENVFQASV